MIAEALLTLTLGSPGTPPEAPQVCVPVPTAPTRIDLTWLDGDGLWGAEATYALSSGEIGRAEFVIDRDGSGEATLAVDGEIIAHVSVAVDPASGQLVTTTWWPPGVAAAPEAIAELMLVDLPVVVADSRPQEFKCGKWKSVAKALWAGASVVAAYTCCAGSTATGVAPVCVACLAGGTIGGSLGADAIEGLCD